METATVRVSEINWDGGNGNGVKSSRKKKFKDNVSRISWHPIPIFLFKGNFVWGEAVGLRVPCRIIVSLRSFHLFPVTL